MQKRAMEENKVSDVRPVPSGPVTPFYFSCPPNLLCPKNCFEHIQ